MMTWDALNEQLDGVAEQREDANSIFNVYKALIEIRKNNPVLARGKVVNRNTTGNVICYSVTDGEHEILIYANATQEELSAGYALPAGATRLYGEGLDGGTISAMSLVIYKVK